jgi:hypothetical protein
MGYVCVYVYMCIYTYTYVYIWTDLVGNNPFSEVCVSIYKTHTHTLLKMGYVCMCECVYIYTHTHNDVLCNVMDSITLLRC